MIQLTNYFVTVDDFTGKTVTLFCTYSYSGLGESGKLIAEMGRRSEMANVIQEQTGADILRIETETPYPVDHETLVALAADEQKETQDLL